MRLAAGELDADDETDIDIDSRDHAIQAASQMRAKGMLAGAFERRDVTYPEHAPPGLDLPPHLYEVRSVRIDEDEDE